eukprot:TRINITY_DN12614_c2_g1_i1.p1 TRINITY_DN12614_c2_g1~~TRINITY_DN12614_c2_g1_i1.p1  ORF type:complete len:232 (+),score=55.38 TRINITY_DN12614_c2_g1_i1:131-826(+)
MARRPSCSQANGKRRRLCCLLASFVLLIASNSVAKMPLWVGGGRRAAANSRVMSLVRRMEAAHGREASWANEAAKLASPPMRRITLAAWAEERLRSSIAGILQVEVQDVSDGHTHEGFYDGSGRSLNKDGVELRVLVVAECFASMNMVQRQQKVHESLLRELRTGAIHSLPHLRTLSPDEWKAQLTPAARQAAVRSNRCQVAKSEAAPAQKASCDCSAGDELTPVLYFDDL